MTHVPPPFEFEYIRSDEWGGAFVKCPVCKQECKLDGVRKHIIGQSKSEAHAEEDLRPHSDWLAIHGDIRPITNKQKI